MESRTITVQDALAATNKAKTTNQANGAPHWNAANFGQGVGKLAMDFQRLLAAKTDMSTQSNQGVTVSPATCNELKGMECTIGAKLGQVSVVPSNVNELMVNPGKRTSVIQSIEALEQDVLSVSQLLSSYSEWPASEESVLNLALGNPPETVPTATLSIEEEIPGSTITKPSNIASSASHAEVEKLVTQQAQRLMVNSPQSVFDSTTDVAIQLKEQVLPGTTLNIKQTIDGGWLVAAQCPNSEIAELLMRAMPQLQSRFKSKDLGEVRLFESGDVDRRDDK